MTFRKYLVLLPSPSTIACSLLGRKFMRFIRYFNTQSLVISHTKQFQNVIYINILCYIFLCLIILHLLTKFHRISSSGLEDKHFIPYTICHVTFALWCGTLKRACQNFFFYLEWLNLVSTCVRHMKTQWKKLQVAVIYRDNVILKNWPVSLYEAFCTLRTCINCLPT